MILDYLDNLREVCGIIRTWDNLRFLWDNKRNETIITEITGDKGLFGLTENRMRWFNGEWGDYGENEMIIWDKGDKSEIFLVRLTGDRTEAWRGSWYGNCNACLRDTIDSLFVIVNLINWMHLCTTTHLLQNYLKLNDTCTFFISL